MKVEIDGNKYNIVIEKKRKTKNTYIRVRENLDIYITTNTLTSDRYIINLVNDNLDSIKRMINKVEKKKEKEKYFYFLGKKYDIVYLNKKGITFGEEKVFVNEDFDIDKFLKKEAKKIFQEELDLVYNRYVFDIPYPSLLIRKMKTRWGVCNIKRKTVTLNLELIKKDLKYLDYVIVHELSHLLYANHSKDFWKCVETNCHDYKKLRKELNNE